MVGHPSSPLPTDGQPPEGAPDDVFVFPTSFSQQRLWFLHQLDPASTSYNVPITLRLHGALDFGALSRGLDTVVARHDTLRTTIAAVDGAPMQVVSPVGGLPLAVEDVGGEVDPEAAACAGATALAAEPFDLAAGPLARGRLFRLAPEEHLLALVFHHIVFDGWSFGVLMRELAAAYAAHAAGHEPDLAPLPCQYADFAAWQRQWLTGDVLAAQRDYWTTQLAGAPPVLALPTDRLRPAVQTYRGAIRSFTLPASLTSRLERLGQDEGATPFMALLAGFQALLHRYTGEEDVVVGAPVANRTRIETEGLIGCFINTLALRTRLDGAPSFRELLGRVRATALGAYAHQDLPFEQLVDALQPVRTLAHSPVFQVLFVFQNTPCDPVDLGGLRWTYVPIDPGTSNFDLTLTLWPSARGLEGVLEYNVDLFDADTIERLLEHFETLLGAVAADPDRPVTAVPLLSPAARHQILDAWNATEAPYPAEATVPALFAAQAARTPDAVAISDEHTRLTYAALERRANQLAHYLRARGVGPEVPVAVCLERSVEAMVAILGILKAGGAYLPLDPAAPAARLRFVLADAGASIAVTRAALGRRTDLGTVADVVCLDADAEAITAAPGEPPDLALASDTLAYVLYTSGSTGQPKGILGCHRGIVNRLAWMWSAHPFLPGEVCVQKTPLVFVDSVAELFGGLLQGVPTTIVGAAVVADPVALVRALAAAAVTRVVLVPTLLRAILDTPGDLDRALPALRLWTSSGEPLAPALAAAFHERLPGRTLLNLYGSTEVAADATCAVVPPAPAGAPVSIGRPIANTRLYVLDAGREPVPVGVAGELWVGGPGVARGYANRPELTAERFVPDPFDPEPAARLFRTGDRVRYRVDGSLEFLGRTDHQVKLRGYRIEPAEIECALRKHPAIAEAAVVRRDDGPGDARLVAYVIARASETLDPTALRSFLATHLASYMLPAAFVRLDAFPLTPSGKIDRRALPAPEGERKARSPGPGAQTRLERTIATAWESVLGVTGIGPRDNFFDLGGSSISLLRVRAKLAEALGIELSVILLFQHPTVATLAAHLEHSGDDPEGRASLSTIRLSQARGAARRDAARRMRRLLQGRRGS
jgi:amino acid adenylation domain-containing protein